MSGRHKTLEQLMLGDAPTAEERLAFADQVIAMDDELLAQTEQDKRRLGERVRTLHEKAPQVTGRRGGKTVRKLRTAIEQFMREELARGRSRKHILDDAERKFCRSRDNLERKYLGPLLNGGKKA